MITLEKPHVRFKGSFLTFIKECFPYLEEETTPFNEWWQSYAKSDLKKFEDFDVYVADKLDTINGSTAKRWKTEFMQYWIIRDSQEFLGTLDIRPRLDNRFVTDIAGNLGIMLRPSAVGKGYSMAAIKEAMDILRKLGLEKILITCNTDNSRSKGMIEKLVKTYSGFYEKTIHGRYWNKDWNMMRFWINSGGRE